MAAAPKDKLGLILSGLEPRGAGFDVHRQAGMRALDSQEHRKRDHDKVVLVLPEDASDLLDGADYRELVISDAQSFPNGIDTEK